MWKLRMCVVAAAGLFAFGMSTAAWGSSGGDSNSGDVWVDNASASSPGPGHEMDPHLACSQINLYGAGLADSSGTFTIEGWPPSGHKEVVYGPAPWSYSGSGTQMIAHFNPSTDFNLSADSRAHNGYHFMLDFSQDPQKHKTFWVNCTPPPSSSTSSSTTTTCPGSTTTTTTTTSGNGNSAGHGKKKGKAKGKNRGKHKGASKHGTSTTTTTTTTSGSSNTCSSPPTTSSTAPPTTSSTAPTSAVKGVHKLRRPKRHHRAKKRKVSGASAARPAFTG